MGDNILTDIKTLYIDDICVDEKARGQGVGRTLYDAVIAFAKESGCYNVTLNVWTCNEGALKFYETMKDELKPQMRQWKSFSDVKASVDDWIDYYNNERGQWQLNRLAPNEFYSYITTGIDPLSKNRNLGKKKMCPCP